MNEEPAAAPVATAELPQLRRILATKQIDRDVGVPIAPGQIVELPADQAEAAIKEGKAKDPDAKASDTKPAAKAKD
jgi:hypothetical protein